MPALPPLAYAPPPGPLRVLYADAAVLVISKPAGLLSVPGKGPHLADCVATRARAAYPGARICHRLDLDTSGIMVLGLTAAAHRTLSMAFEARGVDKCYVARIWGEPEDEAGRIEAPLAFDPDHPPRQRIDPAGRPSVTDWVVMAREGGTARLRLSPVTGRSHQLRVHLLSIGHPILGDPLYAQGAARAAAPRLLLHAETIGFRHPVSRDPVRFTDPCPF